MLSNKTLSDAVRLALGVTTGTLAFGVSSGALAQDDVDDVLEEIVTTGSRIAADPNLITSSPVTTVSADELIFRGITRVEDLVNDLPQMVPEFTSNDSNGSTGTATLDLRGLGSDRTLVLINGHRMGFGDQFALAPDINQIPGALVDRIELLTGGASSTYGSDAVAGVVNFIMKSDFEGFQIDYQYSGYDHSNDNAPVQADIAASGFQQAPSSPADGGTNNVNVLIGVNSDDGSANVTAYLGYRDITGITHSERDFSACALSSGGNGTGCAGSATLPTGLFSPFDGTYFTVAGDQFIPWDYTYYNYAPLNHFQRPDERFTGGVFGHYEVDEYLTGYAEVMFMDDRSLAQIAPSGAFFVTNQINCSNAFLSAQQFATLGCVLPTDVANYYIGRRNVEGGPRFDDLRHTSLRLLAGVRGDIGENWSYDVSGNFARLIYSQVYNNDLSITRIIRALDAVDDGTGTGTVTCASVLNGSDPACVPWNVFEDGAVTQAAINYLTLPLFADGDMTQSQVVGFVTGDLTDAGVVVPWADDGVQVVLGFEYRDENFEFNPDLGFRTGDGAGQGGPVREVNGAVLVKEIFAEARIPIVQDRPGLQSLTLDLKYRYSDYDRAGVTTDTYNIGGEWTPVESIKFRGGFSRAVRAPNIRELFEPVNLGLWSGVDPCGGPTPQLTEAQCTLTGVLPGQYTNIPLSPAGQYNANFGGNTTLIPETSDSITVGVVFTPDFIEGLSVSIDYWSIEVDDAIASGIGEEFTINQCGLTGDPTFCNLITRGPNGNLWIGFNAFVTATNVNIGFFDVTGIDVTASYAWDIGSTGHSLDFSLNGTVLDAFDEQPVPGAPMPW